LEDDMTDTNSGVMTMGDVAKQLGCQAWQVRRLYERNLLPPAPRVGAYRVVPVQDLPRVEKALRTAGYLPDQARAG
jgi:DNA-binding transcriptional MerR regulator